MPDDPRSRPLAGAVISDQPPRAAALLGPLSGYAGSASDLVHERRQPAERRSHSAWSFLYGGLRPRRRRGRRSGDDHSTFPDWHEPRVLYLALAIVLLSCADALFTLNLLAAGGEELNGVMRALLMQDTRSFLWAKIGLTGVGIVVLVAASRRMFLRRFPVMWLLRLFFIGYLAVITWEVYLLGWRATAVGDQAIEILTRWVAG